MNTKEKTKLLTMSLLCCGRADTTEKCLKSLMPIREAVDSEIIVVDTGCDKETRAIVDEYADEVIEFTWCGDFAKARNVQIDAANGKWFLFLDDDEFFIECQDIIDFFNSGEYKNFGFGGYTVRNYHNYEATDWTDSRNGRMTEMLPETHFVGKVHERIEPLIGNSIYFKAYVGHFGYVHRTKEEVVAHAMRNIKPLLEMIEEDPEELINPIQLAQEYDTIADFDKMYEICDEYLKKIRNENIDNKKAESILFTGRLIAENELGRKEQAIKDYEECLNDDRITDLAKAQCAIYGAKLYFTNGQFEKCIDQVNMFLAFKEIYEKDQLKLFLETGIFLYNVFNENSCNTMYCFLMASGIKLDDYSYLKKYVDAVTWQSQFLKINKGYVIYVLEAAINHSENPVIRYALTKFGLQEQLMALLKSAIKTELLSAPKQILEQLKTAFSEDEFGSRMREFITAIEIGQDNLAQFEEIYSLEDNILKQLTSIEENDEKIVEQIRAGKTQLEGIIEKLYGVKSLH